jgi:hypothetical protein
MYDDRFYKKHYYVTACAIDTRLRLLSVRTVYGVWCKMYDDRLIYKYRHTVCKIVGVKKMHQHQITFILSNQITSGL